MITEEKISLHKPGQAKKGTPSTCHFSDLELMQVNAECVNFVHHLLVEEFCVNWL